MISTIKRNDLSEIEKDLLKYFDAAKYYLLIANYKVFNSHLKAIKSLIEQYEESK